jgi:hypothetical protein
MSAKSLQDQIKLFGISNQLVEIRFLPTRRTV